MPELLSSVLSERPLTQATGARAKLLNLSGLPRREWVSFAMPYGVARSEQRATAFRTDRGLMLRAVRGEDVGQHSTIWRVYAPLAGLQQITGEILEPGPSDQDWAMTPHPWAFDDLQALIPHGWVRINGVDYKNDGPWPNLALMPGDSPAHQTWYSHGLIGTSGFIGHLWLTFNHLSPIANLSFAAIWGDPNNPEPTIKIEGLGLLTGEFIAFDFMARNGIPLEPVRLGDKWLHPISGPARLQDGSGYGLKGRMLCLPQVPVGSFGAEWQSDIETLMAAYFGPVSGVAMPGTWDGRWLAHRNVPKLPNAEELAAAKLSAWFQSTDVGTYTSPRPIGCSNRPGNTGNQEDFGASKGWMAVTAGDPRWLDYAAWSVFTETQRGYMFHEATGEPVDEKNHPQWTTWNMVTHYNHNASPDRLGKRDPIWGEIMAANGGWIAYDDQHRSLNNAFAYYALTGDPLMGFCLERAATTWAANVMIRANLGSDVSRAVGRRAHCYANLMLLFAPGSPTYDRANRCQADLVRQFQRDWLGGKYSHGVDVQDVAADPRIGVTYNGGVVPAWSCWGQGLLVNGLYGLWKVTRDAETLGLLKRLTRTAVRYGVFQDASDWVHCLAVAWVDPSWATGAIPGCQTGQPLPGQFYGAGSTLVTLADAGFREWSSVSLQAFVELHDENDPDMARALAALSVMGPTADPFQAEWRAGSRQWPTVPGDAANY